MYIVSQNTEIFEVAISTTNTVLHERSAYRNHLLFVLAIYALKMFAVWCGLVWLVIVGLLSAHCYMTAIGVTTREFAGGKDKYPYLKHTSHNKTHSVKRSWVVNFVDRFWPLETDECFDVKQLDELRVRSAERCTVRNVKGYCANMLQGVMNKMTCGLCCPRNKGKSIANVVDIVQEKYAV